VTELENIVKKIDERNIVVGILGLGRVGLPLASLFAFKGLNVIGIDTNEERVEKIKKGVCPFYDPPLQENLKVAVEKGELSCTNNLGGVGEQLDIIFVTVGTPNSLDNNIDYTQLYGALDEISQINLKNKMLIMRSTLPPKTTVDIVIPFLEQKTGLIAGSDFAIAMCPERILEGKAIQELQELPEIIGGIDETSNKIATKLFKVLNPDKEFAYTSVTGAELAKLFTNIYRYISFALSNEFGIWSEQYGLDATELIRVANYKYPRANIPIPGFVGGPCLTKDGTFLDNNTTFSSIVSTAWKLNESIPQYIINKIKNKTGSLMNKKIAVLGISFKAGSDDTRNSPAVKLIEILKGAGAKVTTHDPYVKKTNSLEETLNSSEIVIVATNHKEFKNIANQINQSGAGLIYDVWGMFNENDFPGKHYTKLGKNFTS
jgi:UDP-N-acetyl-D-mannosaminuronic acid dehydrogenase